MSSFLFEGAFTRLASLDAADYSNLRIALVESAPTVTDEFAADLDETAAANYARKTPTGGALTQTAGKTLVTGTIPTWSALGTAEVLTHWVLFYNTGSDATSWLIAAVSLGHTCNGGDLTISTSGFLVDPTITRASGGGGTAATTTYDDTGNTYVTGADVQAALDATESTLGTVATALGTAAATTTQSNNIDTYLHTVAVTATGGAVTLPLTKSLQVYDLDPADNPWVFTLPDLTGASSGVLLNLFIYAKTGGSVALSFVSAGSAQDVVWSGPAPSEVPEEGYIVVRAQGDHGASAKWNMEWASNLDGWGLTGHTASVSGGTHLFSHAFEHLTFTGTDPTLARDLRDCGGGSGMFWLLLTNSSGSSRTITWGPTMTWVAGSAVSTIANGATVLVMLQTLDSGTTATAVNVTGLGGGSGDLLSTNNLSDLASASTARTNLGLGTAATQASTAFAQVANNLSDVTAATARTNLAVPGTGTLSAATIGKTYGYDGSAVVAEYPRSARHALLAPSGAIAETWDRNGGANYATGTGRAYAGAVALLKGQVVTSITFISGSTAANGPTNKYFALLDSTGAILRLTADDTTNAWAANTPKTLNLSSTYTITSSGVYYLLCAQAASTATASLVSTGQSTFTGIAQQAPVLGVRVDETGLSTPPSLPSSFTIGTQNAGLIPYAYCS